MAKHPARTGSLIVSDDDVTLLGNGKPVSGRLEGWWEPPDELNFTLSREDSKKAIAALSGEGPPFAMTFPDGRTVEFLPPQEKQDA